MVVAVVATGGLLIIGAVAAVTIEGADVSEDDTETVGNGDSPVAEPTLVPGTDEPQPPTMTAAAAATKYQQVPRQPDLNTPVTSVHRASLNKQTFNELEALPD